MTRRSICSAGPCAAARLPHRFPASRSGYGRNWHSGANEPERAPRLRLSVYSALRRDERRGADVVRGLQLVLADGERAVRDRCADAHALGLAWRPLFLARDLL